MSELPTEQELQALVGHRFPGGNYTVEPWRAWLTADAALDQPDPELAHPLFAWLASAGGWGISWDDFFALVGASAGDGPMFGEHESELQRPLRVGETFGVSGEIVSVQRKHGRSAGTFDVVGYRVDLRDDAGEPVASCYNSVVFPRGR